MYAIYIYFLKYAFIIYFSSPAQKNRGHPEIAFKISSVWNKRQKKPQALKNNTHVAGVLSHATQLSLRESGQIQTAELLYEITTTTLKRGSKYWKIHKESQTLKKLSGEDALTVLVDAKLSRH